MDNILLRYIVPFAYEMKKKGSAYDGLNRCLKKSGEWVNVEWDEVEKIESDCYEYLKKLYPKYYDDVMQSGVGTIWEYRGNKDSSLFPTIVYENKEVCSIEINAKVSRIGLFVLKNEIGLFWYETEFIEKKGDPKINLEELTNYQYEIKELARTDHNYYLLFKGKEFFPPLKVKMKSEEEEAFFKDEILQRRKKVEKQSFVDRITGKGKRKNISEISEVIFNLKKDKISINKGTEIAANYQLKSNMPLGSWVHEMLSFPKFNIRYYPGIKHHKENNPQEFYKIPDKAILFQYVAANIENCRLEELAYRLTNGYKKSYIIPSDIRERMYEPFGNMLWYAEKEGCGTYANYNDDNKGFLLGNKKERVCKDYFFMYMNLLQQSYVILKLSEEIATTFSMLGMDYQSGSLKIGKKLEDIQMRINVFLFKSTHASVSHIGHHNVFYEYVEKNLLIKEDIESLREGLDSLNEIQKRHEDDKVTIGLGVLSVFAILGAFRDAEDVIKLFINDTAKQADIITGAYIAIAIIFLLVIIALKDTHMKFFQIVIDEIKEIFRRPRRRRRRRFHLPQIKWRRILKKFRKNT